MSIGGSSGSGNEKPEVLIGTSGVFVVACGFTR